jgi:hypothetical protein
MAVGAIELDAGDVDGVGEVDRLNRRAANPPGDSQQPDGDEGDERDPDDQDWERGE